jgi:hypothetical protein
MSILCDGLRGSYFPPNSGTHRSTLYAANFGAINENWLPYQQRVPSPTTTPDQPAGRAPRVLGQTVYSAVNPAYVATILVRRLV